MTKRKGFTLVELLVAVGIIGVLASITAVSVGNARAKARDARRVADVKAIQNAMELAFNEKEAYPLPAADFIVITATTLCSSTIAAAACPAGETKYLDVPVAPTPPAGNVYTIKKTAASTYEIGFTLETATAGLAIGAHKATPTGLQ